MDTNIPEQEPYIKQEPADDDDCANDPFASAPTSTFPTFSLPTSFSVRSRPVPTAAFETREEYAPISPHVRPPSRYPRAHDSHSNAFQTVCFKGVYKGRPHHHRLICGHEIMTKDIEACGANCELSKTAHQKSGYKVFQCPHRECKQPRTWLLNPRTGRPDLGRTCQLSYVYGHDEEMDNKRVAEKALRPMRANSMSPGPSRQLRHDPTIAENNELATDPARDAILEMRGPGVRRKTRRGFETEAEKEADVEDIKATRALRHLEVESNIDGVARKKAALKRDLAANPRSAVTKADLRETEEDVEEGGPEVTVACDNCDREITGLRYKCFHCPDVDLCETCYNEPSRKHKSHHHFKALHSIAFKSDFVTGIVGWQVSPGSGTAGIACNCNTSSTKWLVLCKGCEMAFHPGCFGLGAWDSAMYEHDSNERDECLRSDWQSWSGGREFKCLSCRGQEVEELEETEDARAARRKNRDKVNQEQKTNSYLTFSQNRQKGKELRECEAEEEQEAVKEKWLQVGIKQQEERDAKRGKKGSSVLGKRAVEEPKADVDMMDGEAPEVLTSSPPQRRTKRRMA